MRQYEAIKFPRIKYTHWSANYIWNSEWTTLGRSHVGFRPRIPHFFIGDIAIHFEWEELFDRVADIPFAISWYVGSEILVELRKGKPVLRKRAWNSLLKMSSAGLQHPTALRLYLQDQK